VPTQTAAGTRAGTTMTLRLDSDSELLRRPGAVTVSERIVTIKH
jgi:hypothetical protein